ncbi:tryptophanyl-tRNA synthetase [Meira miltonrushii]|uniref:Tryptophan--tRNA ligase, mitochondrial n=1 Tax=Meira miltonrushii TaxID=1280837 RepID=A0A316VIP5_9BASI|nr:tryptophanyl-tRNA synthetase [Meira miltonrushii]PWN37416.1 tryptophanyl-tRNA synthetase [Meira miltonrushii]
MTALHNNVRSLGLSIVKLAGYRGIQRSVSASSSRYLSTESQSEETAKEKRKTIFSGIQPTGIPHLGNYLGALQNWVNLQNDADRNGDELFFSIVGLHALTVPNDPKKLFIERREMMAALLAVGIDPNKVTLFHQDQVPEHTELAWILNCITPFGKLNRMTTWKSKLATLRYRGSEQGIDETGLCLGLFAYPVLQAADILLYRATHVPIGEDQVQHLELSRDLADLFNKTYKKRQFPLPQHIITPTKRVLSLRNPKQKMSKSSPDVNSRVLLTDSDDVIKGKIKRAITDTEPTISFDPKVRPGVSNLLSILSALDTIRSPQEWADELNQRAGAEGGAGRILKEAVTDTVISAIRPIREEYQRLQKDPGHLLAMEQLGKEKAQERAAKIMHQVRRLVGLT